MFLICCRKIVNVGFGHEKITHLKDVYFKFYRVVLVVEDDIGENMILGRIKGLKLNGRILLTL